MTEENKTEQTEQKETKESKVESLVVDVANRIKGSTNTVRERLVESMVDKEVNERVGILDKAFQKRAKMVEELEKINKPDGETYDAEGNKLPGTYTKQRKDAITNAKKKLNKFDGLVEQALTKGEFKKLSEAAKQQ